jgi:hypothetical protein
MSTLSDDTQNTTVNEEVEPPCKKPRLLQTHFVHLKLHTRLIIYDFADFEDFMEKNLSTMLLYHLFGGYLIDHSYARMTVSASILGDLEALQYLAGIPDNIFIPKNYDGLRYSSELNGSALLGEDSFDMECVCYFLASNGHWKALKWAITEQFPHKSVVLTGAVEGGADMDMLHWLHSQGCVGDEETFLNATIRGDWNILKWLRAIGCPWHDDTFAAAAAYCDLEVLKWLKMNQCPFAPMENPFVGAANRGDLKILVWLRMEGCPLNKRTFFWAIRTGADLLTLQWFLHEDISLMSCYTFEAAIHRGDIEILEWLRSKNCPMQSNHFVYAIEHKVPMNILEWMYHAQFLLNESAFFQAVKRGDWDILDWLRQKNCPWNASCYEIALANKRFDIVKWLHEEKCPHDLVTAQLMTQEFIKLHEERDECRRVLF